MILEYNQGLFIPRIQNFIIRYESGASSLQVAEKSYKVPYQILMLFQFDCLTTNATSAT